jgi:hypothetical protein
MKGLQFLASGRPRFHDLQTLVQPARHELGEKGRVAIRPERVAIAEAITRQAFASDQQYGWRRHG